MAYDDLKIDDEALAQMKHAGGTWAVYENAALDSANAGHLQFLKYGDDCTYKVAPKTYPADTQAGLGWRYLFVGHVDLETGKVT